jgi:hypothetical protein
VPDEPTDPERFEDYARKMYPQYNRLNVPPWIIGPALGEGPLIERPADVLKVWPTREPIHGWRLRNSIRSSSSLLRGIAVNAVAARDSGFGKIVRLERPIEAGTGQALKVLKLPHLTSRAQNRWQRLAQSSPP